MMDTTLRYTGRRPRHEDNGFSAQKAEATTAVVLDGITEGVATWADIAQLSGRINRPEAGPKWMKPIGGAILAVLILPWLTEPLSLTIPDG